MARVLISAAGYETASYYALFYARRMANELLTYGHIVDFLENPSADRVYDNLSAEVYEYYYHTGHGCESVTTTVGGEDLFWTEGFCSTEHSHSDVFISVLPDFEFVFLLSCLCGQRLVPKIASSGGRVAGFVEEFTWVAVPPYVPGGSDDTYSRWFFEPANHYFIVRVSGATSEEAYNETLEVFEASIDHWRNSSDELATICINVLIMDMNAFLVQTEDMRVGGSMAKGSNLLPLILLGGAALGGLYMLKKVK